MAARADTSRRVDFAAGAIRIDKWTWPPEQTSLDGLTRPPDEPELRSLDRLTRPPEPTSLDKLTCQNGSISCQSTHLDRLT